MKLLKTTFLTLTLSILSCTLFAQAGFGIRAGITLPNQSIEFDGIEFSGDANLGLYIAALLELGITGNFAIQPEIGFFQKGIKIDELKTRLNHIDVPILAKVKFGNDAVAAFVAAGPSLGYAISGSSEEDGEKTTFEDEDWDGYNRFELGGVIAAGAGLRVGNGQVFLDLRYFLSLNNLSDEDEIKARNKGVAIGIGYLSNF